MEFLFVRTNESGLVGEQLLVVVVELREMLQGSVVDIDSIGEHRNGRW